MGSKDPADAIALAAVVIIPMATIADRDNRAAETAKSGSPMCRGDSALTLISAALKPGEFLAGTGGFRRAASSLNSTFMAVYLCLGIGVACREILSRQLSMIKLRLEI